MNASSWRCRGESGGRILFSTGTKVQQSEKYDFPGTIFRLLKQGWGVLDKVSGFGQVEKRVGKW